jgi:glutamate racemase
LFVPLVEEGWHSPNDIVVLETVKRYLKPIIEAGADTLILGCTHYPVLSEAIKKVVGDGVTLIDAGTATSMAVKKFLSNKDMLNEVSENTRHKFFVSDKPETFTRIASDLLGKSIDDKSVEQVDLSSL